MNRTVNDTWLRVVGISLLTGLSILSDDAVNPLTKPGFVSILLNVASIGLTWQLNRAIIIGVRAGNAFRTPLVKRLAITFLSCVLATTLFAWCFDAFRYLATHGTLTTYQPGDGTFKLTFGTTVITPNAYGMDFFHGIFIAVFFLIVYELLFYSQDSSLYRQRLEQSEREKEQLRVANMQSQLDVLKQQVNPHFLFNSLNTLSSLIREDPEQAEQFVDKLSGVYRYVLRANRGDGAGPEQHLTTVEAELQFIDAYYHLLQTRYGTGISLVVAVDVGYRSCQLPPLTLQLLIENAVKHNVVSPKRPLRIGIAVDEQGRLVVENTLQRKATRALSNGVGLTNIVAKYQMLNLPQPSVEESTEQFTVRLPLLACAGGAA